MPRWFPRRSPRPVVCPSPARRTRTHTPPPHKPPDMVSHTQRHGAQQKRTAPRLHIARSAPHPRPIDRFLCVSFAPHFIISHTTLQPTTPPSPTLHSLPSPPPSSFHRPADPAVARWPRPVPVAQARRRRRPRSPGRRCREHRHPPPPGQLHHACAAGGGGAAGARGAEEGGAGAEAGGGGRGRRPARWGLPACRAGRKGRPTGGRGCAGRPSTTRTRRR